MRLLLDENLSPIIARLLTDAGIEAVHVRDLGMRTASDAEILVRARNEGLVVVSQDSDFTNLLAAQAATRPSLILLRIPQAVTAADIASLLAANLDALRVHLEAGAVASVGHERIRVRRLPLR